MCGAVCILLYTCREEIYGKERESRKTICFSGVCYLITKTWRKKNISILCGIYSQRANSICAEYKRIYRIKSILYILYIGHLKINSNLCRQSCAKKSHENEIVFIFSILFNPITPQLKFFSSHLPLFRFSWLFSLDGFSRRLFLRLYCSIYYVVPIIK